MPLDSSAVGLSMKLQYTYSWRDVILYNLSVGAQQEELEYVYEKRLKVLPTFGSIPCTATFGTNPRYDQPVMPTSLIPDLKTAGTMHMDNKLVIYKPIPLEATLEVEKVISGVYDRGLDKGAKINVDVIARDDKGDPLFINTMGYLNRWHGGFGGPPVPKSDIAIPDRDPDQTAEGAFPMNAPLLYRLTGDTYYLHVDPEFAGKFGFQRPIVHGLCSLGYACRMLIGMFFPGEPERMVSLENQFRNVAMPGDSFRVQAWKTGDARAVFRMVDAQGKAILDYGRITWR